MTLAKQYNERLYFWRRFVDRLLKTGGPGFYMQAAQTAKLDMLLFLEERRYGFVREPVDFDYNDAMPKLAEMLIPPVRSMEVVIETMRKKEVQQ